MQLNFFQSIIIYHEILSINLCSRPILIRLSLPKAILYRLEKKIMSES